MDDLSRFEAELQARAGNRCELCQGKEALDGFALPPKEPSAAHCVLVCSKCRAAMSADDLDAKSWFGLKESIWSEVPAVQVLSWRLLKRMDGESWVQDLLGQIYLDEETEAWASATSEPEGEESVTTLDSNGAVLADGDSVTIIKDLDVKGTGFVAKRGTMVKNIRLIDDPENIEGRVNKTTLVLKTKFLKKVN